MPNVIGGNGDIWIHTSSVNQADIHATTPHFQIVYGCHNNY